ncbi:hypothetical protein [Thermoleptolyngbya sp. M55_K2018_002]|uniref:hypothetical protein n=1 Tax=Thermoleptolyngbya sp. M55_K2018_002 TaxID=2747808 RepID=UPI001A062774|nr:hypothetical protein [Thermoleptolyngbya sp. M55_K2018_002]HIK42133.1 hypothetical protein [Thermoleptolyngbya sp. M55_K2018_002]
MFQAPSVTVNGGDRAAYSFQKGYNCRCCFDSGFAVLRQAEIDSVMPSYDPHLSPPIYCNRRTCHGRKQFASKEGETAIRWDIPVGGADYSREPRWAEFCEALHLQRQAIAVETDAAFHQRRQRGASPENESGLKLRQIVDQARSQIAGMPKAQSLPVSPRIIPAEPQPPEEVDGFRVGDRVVFDISGFSKSEQREIRQEGSCPYEGRSGTVCRFDYRDYSGAWGITVRLDDGTETPTNCAYICRGLEVTA